MTAPPPGRVSLLVTCLVDFFQPSVGEATVALLARRGLGVEVPAGQTCCGLPFFNSGYRAEAARLARRVLDLFAGAGRVVAPSGSCAWMVRAEYPHLFPGDAAATAAARALAARTVELSQLLDEHDRGAAPGTPTAGRGAPGPPLTVAYHDSCHLLRGLGEAAAPRRLLDRCPGVRRVELEGADECCGFGGSFAVRLPDVSGAILRRKLDRVARSGADAVVACDAGCLAQIAGGLARSGAAAPVRALHLAELLEERERGGGPGR
jgi:L-lactate dehydrogenase complex protein LldE